MKTTLIYFLLLASTSFFIYTSCSNQQSEQQVDYSIPNAKQIIDQFNSDKLPSHQATYLKGALEIVSSDQEISIFVKGDDDMTPLYILQKGKMNSSDKIRKSLSDAEILFFHNGLLINSLESDFRYFLSVDETIPDYLNSVFISKFIKGYGLIRYNQVPIRYDSFDEFDGGTSIFNHFKSISILNTNTRSDESPGIFVAVECKCCTASGMATTPPSTPCGHVLNQTCTAGGPGAISCGLSPADGSLGCQVNCGTGSSGGTACCYEVSGEN